MEAVSSFEKNLTAVAESIKQIIVDHQNVAKEKKNDLQFYRSIDLIELILQGLYVEPAKKVNQLIQLIKKVACQTTVEQPQDKVYDGQKFFDGIMDCFDLCGRFFERQQTLYYEMFDLQIAKTINVSDLQSFDKGFEAEQKGRFEEFKIKNQNSRGMENYKAFVTKQKRQQYEEEAKFLNDELRYNIKLQNAETKLVTEIKTVIERSLKKVVDRQDTFTKDHILSQLPKPCEGKLLWPSLQTLKDLSFNQIEYFRLEQFQYWDNSIADTESDYNIAFRLFGSHGLQSGVNCSKLWSAAPEDYPANLKTIDLKDVSKIEVYEGVAEKGKGSYICGLVFYKDQMIFGCFFAGKLVPNITIETIKNDFIDMCPGNGFQLLQAYETPQDSALVGFEFEDKKDHPSFGPVLPYIRPIYWNMFDY